VTDFLNFTFHIIFTTVSGTVFHR